MGGEGHIADMISRMKANTASKNAHKELREKIRDVYQNAQHNEEQNKIRSFPITSEKLENLKLRIKSNLTRERRLSTLISILLTCVISFLIFYFLFQLGTN